MLAASKYLDQTCRNHYISWSHPKNTEVAEHYKSKLFYEYDWSLCIYDNKVVYSVKSSIMYVNQDFVAEFNNLRNEIGIIGINDPIEFSCFLCVLKKFWKYSFRKKWVFKIACNNDNLGILL